MTTEPDGTERLRALVEVLGTRDWRRVAEAERELLAAGQAAVAAVLAGLSHPRPRVRRGCAGFFDHHGTEACVPGLTRALLADPVANVRREAVHSLACDRCKAAPLGVDAVPLLIERIENYPSAKVRAEAVFGLTRQPREAVAALAPPVLRRLLADPDEDARVRREAHLALRLCDPAYRAETDARARERAGAAAP
jgi:HEAT repeat protein